MKADIKLEWSFENIFFLLVFEKKTSINIKNLSRFRNLLCFHQTSRFGVSELTHHSVEYLLFRERSTGCSISPSMLIGQRFYIAKDEEIDIRVCNDWLAAAHMGTLGSSVVAP